MTKKIIYVFLLGILSVLAISGCVPQSSASAPEIGVVEANDLFTKQETFFLDVREQEEWDAVHIPGTTLIPLGQLAERINEVPKDKNIVVVCRSGNRSQQGRDILKQAGITNVTSMAGGITEWSKQGFPIEP